MAQPLPRTGFKFTASITSGPDAGATYQLLPPRVTIGRDPTCNNVVLNDPRVSRSAATIEFSPDQIIIHDVSGKAKLAVNGIYSERHSIKNGDVIRVGETELVFIVEALQLSNVPALTSAPAGGGLSLVASDGPSVFGGAADSKPARRSKRSSQGGSRFGFYFVAFGVLGGMIYLGLSETPSKKLDRGIRSTSEIEKELSETDIRISSIAKKRSFRTEEEKTRFEEAQRHFLEGFRDYQKGGFTRAMRSFETARAIDPEHQLALRYYRLAEKQRDEAITQLILEGRRYLEKNMYTRCSSALEKALLMMTNRDDLKYRQAEAMKKECDLLRDGRYP